MSGTKDCPAKSKLDLNETSDKQLSILDEALYPEALNHYHLTKIRDLEAKNESLQRALEESELELRQAKKSSSFTHLGKSTEAIVKEQSKKCREKTAEVEVLKLRIKQLEEKLMANEDEMEILRATQIDPDSFVNQLSRKDDEIKALNELLVQTNTKLYASKNACTVLKQEINKAQKLLSSEIGENVTISSLANHPGGWRGRADQIKHLSQKVSELQAKLGDFDKSSCRESSSSIEQRNLANLRAMEKERRQQLQNNANELRKSEVALETYKRKLEAARARIKVLEGELNASRSNVALLNEKQTHNEHLIQTLNKQMKSVENRFYERQMELESQKENLSLDCTRLRNELNGVLMQVDQLSLKLDERETELQMLRSGEITRTPVRSSTPCLRSEFASPRSTCRSEIFSECITLKVAAECERDRLMELIGVLNRRIDKERSDNDRISKQLRLEQTRSAKLEAKLQKIETDRVGKLKINNSYRRRSKSISAGGDAIEMREQNQYRLELLEEECLALKARLSTLQQEKHEDLETYRRMLDKTKQTFDEATRCIGNQSAVKSCISSHINLANLSI